VAEQLYKTDPFVLAAGGAKDILIQHEVYARFAPSQRLQYLMRTFGIGNRTIVLLRRNTVIYGAVCFIRDAIFSQDEIEFLEMVAQPLHTRITAPLMQRFALASMRLSQGELVCITNASFGMTSEDIAACTGYQKDTVDSYLKAATKKLGASNRVQAVSEAIRRRLIE
jgi:LuxR family transcriptional regulator